MAEAGLLAGLGRRQEEGEGGESRVFLNKILSKICYSSILHNRKIKIEFQFPIKN